MSTCADERTGKYKKPSFDKKLPFCRTLVRSLAMLVTKSLTDSCLVNLIDVTLACEDDNSNLLRLLLLLMLMMRNVLVEVMKSNLGQNV